MTLKERITEDIKAAMRAKEAPRLSALRLLLAAVKQREVDERIILTDSDIVTVVDRMLRQRRESISQYQTGGRPDLAAAEQFEIDVLSTYMPQAMSADEIDAAVAQAIASVGAGSLQDMGKVMAALKPQLVGRADMAKVSALVKGKLSG